VIFGKKSTSPSYYMVSASNKKAIQTTEISGRLRWPIAAKRNARDGGNQISSLHHLYLAGVPG
jgi:hypothetical protein